MSTGIILFTRAPIPGRTKTRLQSHLSIKQCADLHKAFLADMNNMLVFLQEKLDNINLYLCFTPKDKEKVFDGIISNKFNYYPQKGKDIGERMYNSLDDISKIDNKQILIGSDLPSFQPKVLEDVINKLAKNDIVIGPSDDGGYYLIGCKQPNKKLFSKINWESSNVCEQTIDIIKENNLTYKKVSKCLDIDYYSDLVHLYKKIIKNNKLEFYPENTAKKLYKIFDEKETRKEVYDGSRNFDIKSTK